MRKWMRSRTREELWLCANGNTLGYAVIRRKELWYLKDCNVAAHSVDSDIFYVVIRSHIYGFQVLHYNLYL